MFQIKRLTDLDIRSQVLAEFKEIFFLTSSRTIFASEMAKEEFYLNWTKYYLSQEPENVYLAISDNGELLGYLTGCLNSLRAMDNMKLPSLKLFSDQFRQYPAHFHINCHPQVQGKGVGSALTKLFVDDLKDLGIRGVHIVTSPAAPNVAFYKKNGFTFTDERELNGAKVLFMGLAISA